MFEEPAEFDLLRTTATEVAEKYGPEYWREKDTEGEFGVDFWEEMAEAGFQGLLIDEAYGGAGMGMAEMTEVIETLGAEGTGIAGPWYLIAPVVMVAEVFHSVGTDEQKQRFLPDLAAGEDLYAYGITEPDAGTNTLAIETTAEKVGDEFVVDGKKVWSTFADRADKYVLVARTTSREEVSNPTDGITLFVVEDFADNPAIDVTPIPKHGIRYSKSCEVFLDGVHIPERNVLGEVGAGWDALLDSINTERIGFAAAAVGVGKLAAEHAIDYANEREVFDGPIGQYQGIQFPITEAYSRLECAALLARKAAWQYDRGEECGLEANMSKAVAVDAGIDTVYHSMQTFGGWGYAVDYDVERWWREINLTRLAPVTQQMAYNFIAQQLGFPRSY